MIHLKILDVKRYYNTPNQFVIFSWKVEDTDNCNSMEGQTFFLLSDLLKIKKETELEQKVLEEIYKTIKKKWEEIATIDKILNLKGRDYYKESFIGESKNER